MKVDLEKRRGKGKKTAIMARDKASAEIRVWSFLGERKRVAREKSVAGWVEIGSFESNFESRVECSYFFNFKWRLILHLSMGVEKNIDCWD